MMRRLALAGLLLSAPLLMGQRYQYDRSDSEWALRDKSALVRCISWAESRNDPNAVGRAGERGLLQLLPPSRAYPGGGLLGDFRAFAHALWPHEIFLEPEPEWNPHKQAIYGRNRIDLLGWGPVHWSTYWMCA